MLDWFSDRADIACFVLRPGSPPGVASVRSLNSKLKSAARLLKQAVGQKIMPVGTASVDVMQLTGADVACKLQVASPETIDANQPITSNGPTPPSSKVFDAPGSATLPAPQPGAADSQPQGVRTYVMLPLDTVREDMQHDRHSSRHASQSNSLSCLPLHR